MKKRELVKNFLIGGCVGKTLMEVSGIIANLFMKNNLTDAILQLKSLLVIFVVGGILYIVAKMSITKIEKKDMKSKERQNLLKKQMYITAGAIVIFSAFLVVYTIKRNFIGVILALSFCAVFSFWGYAFLLSYINLKNSMAMINKRDFKKSL